MALCLVPIGSPPSFVKETRGDKACNISGTECARDALGMAKELRVQGLVVTVCVAERHTIQSMEGGFEAWVRSVWMWLASSLRQSLLLRTGDLWWLLYREVI